MVLYMVKGLLAGPLYIALFIIDGLGDVSLEGYCHGFTMAGAGKISKQ